MTRFLTSAALAAFALSAAPSAAQTGPAEPPKSITRATIVQETKASFGEMDTNKDGAISKAELQAAQTKAVQAAQADRTQRMEAEFKKLDTDKNGSLSMAEFKAAVPPAKMRVTPDEALAGFDANKDGKISLDEYSGPRLAMFDKADTNKDGTVTAAEFEAATR